VPEIWNDLRSGLSQRRSRRSYFHVIAGLLLLVAPVAFFIGLTRQVWLVYPVVLIFSLLSVFAMIQRCHDFNFPGWPVLAWLFFDGALTIAMEKNWDAAVTWLAIPVALGKLLFFALLFVPGTRGPNRYGADPGDLSTSVVAESTVWKQ